MNAFLKANGIKMQYVGNGYGNFSEMTVVLSS